MSNKVKKDKRRSKIPAGELALWGTIAGVALIALGIFLLSRDFHPSNVQQPTTPALTPHATLTQGSPTQAATQVVPVPTTPGVITLQQALAMYQSRIYFLDVRLPADFAMYRIPNSVSIPLANLESRAGEVPPDKDIVIVCLDPQDCLAARDILTNAGLTRLFPMSDSIEAWVLSGYPFEGNFPN